MRSKSLRVALVVLAAFGCSRQSGRDAFTRSVAGRLRAALPGAAVAVAGPLQVAITPRNGKQTSLDLTSLWKDCGERVECGEPVEQYVRSVVPASLAVEVPAKREYLRPVLRTKENLPAAGQLVSRPFVGELVVAYVFDSGDSKRAVAPGDLEALGLDEAGVHAAALANLEAARQEIPHAPSESAPRIQVVATGDAYAASLLLLPQRWEALRSEVQGDLIVVAPHQGFVFLTGSGEDKATRGQLKALAVDRLDGAGALSLAPLKWTPAGWVPFAG